MNVPLAKRLRPNGILLAALAGGAAILSLASWELLNAARTIPLTSLNLTALHGERAAFALSERLSIESRGGSADRRPLPDDLHAALSRDALNEGRAFLILDSENRIRAAVGHRVADTLNASAPSVAPDADFLGGFADVRLNGRRAWMRGWDLSPHRATMIALQDRESLTSRIRDRALRVSAIAATALAAWIGLCADSERRRRRSRRERDSHRDAVERLERALARGRCGLWNWDLGRGRVSWSRSMSEMLGLPPQDSPVSCARIDSLRHPDEPPLEEMAERMLSSGLRHADHQFRLRGADGDWLWFRMRAELLPPDAEDGRRDSPSLVGIALDVTERKRAEERKREADRRLRDALENISEAFALWDSSGRLVMRNDKHRALRGESDAMPTREETEGEIETQLSDGRWFRVSRGRTSDGGFISVSADITDLKTRESHLRAEENRARDAYRVAIRSQKALERSNDELHLLAENLKLEKTRAEEASRSKSRFLAAMSHELRTPLNAVIGFAEVMERGMFGPLGDSRYLDYASDIRKSGQFLLDMIGEILDMARLDAGRRPTSREAFAVSEVVSESLAMIASAAREKNVAVSASGVDSSAPIEMIGDRRALKQTLLNLLSNAVKYTPSGGRATVSATRIDPDDSERARSDGTWVRVDVRDEGIGIPSDVIGRLGRPFERAEGRDPHIRSEDGVGLGLAIARSLLERGGGRLSLSSAEGRGTRASALLPLRPPPSEAQGSHAAHGSHAGQGGHGGHAGQGAHESRDDHEAKDSRLIA